MSRRMKAARRVREALRTYGHKALTVLVLVTFAAEAVLGNGVAYAAAAGLEAAQAASETGSENRGGVTQNDALTGGEQESSASDEASGDQAAPASASTSPAAEETTPGQSAATATEGTAPTPETTGDTSAAQLAAPSEPAVEQPEATQPEVTETAPETAAQPESGEDTSATATVPREGETVKLNHELVNSLLGSASVTKEWKGDDNNAYALRPDGVEVTLQARLLDQASGEPATASSGDMTSLFGWRNASALLTAVLSQELGQGQTIDEVLGNQQLDDFVLDATNGWKHTWTHLPLVVNYNGDTYDVEYRAVETGVGKGDAAQVVALNPASGATGASGAFADEKDADGNDALYTSDKWYYSYDPSQVTKRGTNNNPSYATTVTNTLDSTSEKVTKVRDDQLNAWLTRPGTGVGENGAVDTSWELSFALQRSTDNSAWSWVTTYGADAVESDLSKYDESTVVHVTMKSEDAEKVQQAATGLEAFAKEWKNLPKRDLQGSEYTYRVVEIMQASRTGEASVGGYEIDNNDGVVTPDGIAYDADGNVFAWVVVGSGADDSAQSYTNKLPTVDLTGTKAWNTYGVEGLVPDVKKAPDMVLWRQVGGNAATAEQVYRYEDDKPIVPQPTWTSVDANSDGKPDKDADGNYLWTYTYEGLPQYDENGQTYTYWAEEVDDANDAFAPSYGAADAAGTVTTNPNTGTALDDQQGTTITNTATRFTLDKVSDDTNPKVDGDQTVQVNDVTLALTKGGKIFAVWQRDSQSNKTSYVWPEGTGSDAGMTEDSIKGLIADISTNGGIAMTDDNAGYLVGLPAGTYTISEVGYPEAGYAPMLGKVGITISKAGDVMISSGATHDGETVASMETVSDDSRGTFVKLNIVDPVLRGHLQLTNYLTDDGQVPTGEDAAGELYSDALFALYRVVEKDGKEVGVKIVDNLQPKDGVITTIGSNVYIHPDNLPNDDELKINRDRYVTLGDGLPEGTYYFVETHTGSAAVTPDENHNQSAYLTITQDDHFATTGEPVAVEMGNKAFSATVRVPKLDATSGTGIEGAQFQLSHRYIDARGMVHYETLPSDTGTYKTDAQGILTLEHLEAGRYELIEVSNPGYDVSGERVVASFSLYDEDQGRIFDMTVADDRKDVNWKGENDAFEIGDTADDPTGITNTRLTGSVAVDKTVMDGDDAGADPDPLNGATFRLEQKTGTTWDGSKEIATGLKTGKVYRYDEKNEQVAEDTSATATPVDGRITVSGLPWGTYRFVETASVGGYTNPTEDKVSGDLTIGRYSLNPGAEDTGNFIDTITNDPTQLELRKVNEDDTPLQGAAFTVTPVKGSAFATPDADSSKTAPRTLSMGTDGTATLAGQLVVGNSYTIKESTAPGNQYDSIDGSFTIKVEADGSLAVVGDLPAGYARTDADGDGTQDNNFSFTATDPYFSFTLKKLGETDGDPTPLDGAKFTLTGVFAKSDGTQVSKTFTLGSFNEDGTLAVHDLTENDVTYHLMKNTPYMLTETSPQDGYTVVDAFSFQLDAYGAIAPADDSTKPDGWTVSGDGTGTDAESMPTVTATDARTRLVLQKFADDITPLAGAEFTVTPADPENDRFAYEPDNEGDPSNDGKIVLTTSTDGKTEALEGALIVGDRYVIEETKAPDGYIKIAGTLTVEVQPDGSLVVADGTTAPSEFQITGDGTVQAFTGTVTNHPTKLALTKRDKDTNQTIANVAFTLSGTFANGESSQNLTTGSDGTVELDKALLIADGTTEYTLHETVPPAGYEAISDLRFTVGSDGSITVTSEQETDAGWTWDDTNGIALTAHDDAIEIDLKKVDPAGHTIPGGERAQFVVKPASADDAFANMTPEEAANGITVKPATMGTALNGRLIVGNSYTIEETLAPAGYELIDGALTFTVNTDGTISEVSDPADAWAVSADGDVAVITAHDRPVEITLMKNGSDNEAGLSGATFEVYAGNAATGTPMRTVTTEDGGTASLDGFTADAAYTLHETVAPAGYELMPDVTFTVNAYGSVAFTDPAAATAAGYDVAEENGVVTITATDPAIAARLVKTDGAGTPLPGAVFTLAPAEGSTFADGSTEARTLSATDATGSVNIPAHILEAGNHYTLTEVTAPDGFELAGSATFAVDEHGAITLEGQSGATPVAGADGSGTYATSVAADGTVTITATDAPVQITLTKQSKAGNPLTGARFILTEVLPDGSTGTPATIAPEPSPDGATFTFTDLVAGSTYELRETAAPAGYEQIAGSLTFTVAADGTIEAATGDGIANDPAFTINEQGKVAITATDEPIEISLEKWGTDGAARPDATFELTGVFAASALDGTAEPAETTRTINAEGGAATFDRLVAGSTYVLREVATQAGYRVIAGTLTFTVNADGTIQTATGDGIANDPAFTVDDKGLTVRAENESTQITLAKVDETGATLAGATFELTGDYANADGTVESDHTWTLEPGESPATADGLIVSNGTDRHEYTLTEVTAPAGFEQLGAFTFALTPQGTIEGAAAGYTVADSGISITAADTPIQAQLMKTDEAGNPLAGAIFELAPADGSTFAGGSTDPITLTTGEDGTAPIERALLAAGETYTVTEATAPGGYELAGSATLRVNADGSVTLLGDDGAAAAVVPGREGSGTYTAAQDGTGLVTITASDAPVAVQLIKVDGTTPLTGACFSLAPADGSTFADGGTTPLDLTVNADGLTALPGLLAGATYVLTETVAPAGYELNATAFTFTVGADGTIAPAAGTAQDGYAVSGTGTITITVNDEPIELELAKTDLAGNPLTGATFTLTGRFATGDGTATDGETRTVTVDGDDGVAALEHLVAGEAYTLTETTAPAGYELADPITFLVCEDGTVALADGTDAALAARVTIANDAADGIAVIGLADEPIEITLKKYSVSGDELAGARFSITGTFADGATSRTVTVGANGTAALTGLVGGETYTVIEVAAPAGYALLKDPWSFAVTPEGTVTADDTSKLGFFGTRSAGYAVDEDGLVIAAFDEPQPLEPQPPAKEEPPSTQPPSDETKLTEPPAGETPTVPPATEPPVTTTQATGDMPSTGDGALPAAAGLGLLALLFIAGGLRLRRRHHDGDGDTQS